MRDKNKLTHRFDEALAYTAELHRSQVRKGTTIPYLSHLTSVAALVLEDGGDEDQAIAALLHDAIEDQPRAGQTREEIWVAFGQHVLAIVEACSEPDDETTERSPRTWRVRKERYLTHIETLNAEARRVSLADKLHNARSILADLRRHGASVFDRFNAPQADVLWYYRALVTAFRAKHDDFLVQELDRIVTEIAMLAEEAERSRPPKDESLLRFGEAVTNSILEAFRNHPDAPHKKE